jgi:hypothetical protein
MSNSIRHGKICRPPVADAASVGRMFDQAPVESGEGRGDVAGAGSIGPGHAWAAILLLLILLVSGCASRKVDETYGKRRGKGAGSLNGTAVLADMFRERGARVVSSRELSPKLERADCIVWFPNDFAAPTAEQRDYLEDWLYEGERTLVYVGRDFDAASLYWQRTAADAPPEQLEELLRRAALARSQHDRLRTELDDQYDAEWFTIETNGSRRKVEQLEGPWSKGLDPRQADIHLQATLEPPAPPKTTNTSSWNAEPEAEVLLSSRGDPLIYRLTSDNWYGSEILVVANGSMVLNMPLVNKENRKLAGKLIDECLPAEQVVFLESEHGGPPVLSSEPQGKSRTGWEAFTIYPLGVILMHLAVTGILFCFAWFAIFGRPRTMPDTRISNFGHHIAALGKLLSHTGDADYARTRLRTYNQTARRDSGASHVKPKK